MPGLLHKDIMSSPGSQRPQRRLSVTLLMYLANPTKMMTLKLTMEKGPNEEPEVARRGHSRGLGWAWGREGLGMDQCEGLTPGDTEPKPQRGKQLKTRV